MKTRWTAICRWGHSIRVVLAFLAGLFLATSVFAQARGNSPWENAVGVLQQAFTSTIARGLSLVAIVVSGLTFAFGVGGSKRVLAGVRHPKPDRSPSASQILASPAAHAC
jgi:type IV secretory pathway VirB2 component (pilin)